MVKKYYSAFLLDLLPNIIVVKSKKNNLSHLTSQVKRNRHTPYKKWISRCLLYDSHLFNKHTKMIYIIKDHILRYNI